MREDFMWMREHDSDEGDEVVTQTVVRDGKLVTEAIQPPATPQESEQPVNGYTLQGLSNYFGWGLRDDRAIWRFIHERESLLRLCQSLLGTEKSKAQTAELAIRERIEQLSTPSPEGQTTWQPIETAPKDGTPVLLFAEASIQHDSAPKPFVHVSRWVRETREWWEPKSAWEMRLVVEDASHWESWEIPTRWMPLPSPPTPEGTQP